MAIVFVPNCRTIITNFRGWIRPHTLANYTNENAGQNKDPSVVHTLEEVDRGHDPASRHLARLASSTPTFWTPTHVVSRDLPNRVVGTGLSLSSSWDDNPLKTYVMFRARRQPSKLADASAYVYLTQSQHELLES